VLDEDLAEFGVVDDPAGARELVPEVGLRPFQSLRTCSGWLASIGRGAKRGSPWVTRAQVKAEAFLPLAVTEDGLDWSRDGRQALVTSCQVSGSRHHACMTWRRWR
jgi:hypothetical protein